MSKINKEYILNLLQDIGIENGGEFDKNLKGNLRYTIILKDSDTYAAYYSLLDGYEDAILVNDSSMLSEIANMIAYEVDNVKISLNADFENNYYSCVVEEIDEEED